ncbi:MAG: DEAD/DEAH box helicase [Candidatus Bathyarchaeia archaeon]
MPDAVLSTFSKPLRREIERLGWSAPTEIQEMAIPLVMGGENVLLIAPTGTGKTEAAVFPIFERFVQRRGSVRVRGISILYVTPLRALNRDIFRRLIDVGENLGIEVAVRHGDTPQRVRRMQAIKPPDMLITTPETLQAILPGRRMRQHLRSVRWVVVDEVHELATDERGVQLSIGLERLREITGRDFQRIGLSATIGDPDLIAHFLVGKDRNVRFVKAVGERELEVWVESPTARSEDAKAAEEVMISPGSVRRIRRLFELIDQHRSTLVFTNTREHAEALASRMHALKHSLEVGVHHGSLSKDVRVEAERGLKEGRLRAVVCTSSLELGIDVGGIEFVAQYTSPRQVTRLIQRVGRSGHAIGKVPRGCVLAAWPDDILEAAVISRFAVEGRLEEPMIHDRALDVLAHQVVGLVLDWGRVGLRDAYATITRAWPYRNLEVEELISVVKQLEGEGIVWFDGEWVRRRRARTFGYYYSNLSMIPDVKRYDIIDFFRRRRIGTLDQGFVARNGRPGQEFIMHGQTWRMLSIDDGEGVVQVEPVPQSLGAVPSWEGEIIPVPVEVAQEVGKTRGAIAERLGSGRRGLDVVMAYPVDAEAALKAVSVIRRQIEGGYPVPTDRRVLAEGFENYAIVHACFGDPVNETLGKVLAALLSARLGVNVATRQDPYRIALITPIRPDPNLIKEELTNLKPGDIDLVLANTLGETALFAWRLWGVAKRFGAVEREAEYSSSRARMLVKALHDTPVCSEAFREIYKEKLDVDKAKGVVGMIQAGDVEVEAVWGRRGDYSPLALPILDRIAPQDILRPAVPTREIVEVVRERLNSRRVRLVCVFNADHEGVRSVRTLRDRVRCPRCGSTLMAATYPTDLGLIRIAKRRMSGRALTKEEEKTWLTAWRSASLVQTYGKRAVVALAARGVGPKTATRILGRFHRTEEEFYMDIIRAERDYVRTRAFWDN